MPSLPSPPISCLAVSSSCPQRFTIQTRSSAEGAWSLFPSSGGRVGFWGKWSGHTRSLTQKGPALDLMLCCPSLKVLSNFILQQVYCHEDLKGWRSLCMNASCPCAQFSCSFGDAQESKVSASSRKCNMSIRSMCSVWADLLTALRDHTFCSTQNLSQSRRKVRELWGPEQWGNPLTPFLLGYHFSILAKCLSWQWRHRGGGKLRNSWLISFQSFLTTRECGQDVCILIVRYNSRVSFVQCFHCWK